MRMLLAGDAEGVCSGTGGGVTESVGEMDDSGDSSVIGDAAGDGDSCAKATDARNAIKIAVLALAVMSSGVGTSLIR